MSGTAANPTNAQSAARPSLVRRPFATFIRNKRNMRSQASIYEGSHLRAALDDKDSPVLYTHVLCPYAQRAWLALLEKARSDDFLKVFQGIAFRTVNVDLSSKPSWYTLLNPAGLVPAVALRGNVLTESLDVCSWVDETLPGRPLVLEGKEKVTRQLIRDCDKFVSAGLSLLAGATGRSWVIGGGQTALQKQAFLREVERSSQYMEEKSGPFLTGRQPSLADIAYYPFAERFALAMPEFCGFDLRGAGKVGSWLSAMEQRDSVRTTSADSRLFLQALKRYRSLDFFDFETFTAAQLHPHLLIHVATT